MYFNIAQNRAQQNIASRDLKPRDWLPDLLCRSVKRLGIKLEYLALRLKVDRSTISRWLHGYNKMPVEQVPAWTREVDTDLLESLAHQSGYALIPHEYTSFTPSRDFPTLIKTLFDVVGEVCQSVKNAENTNTASGLIFVCRRTVEAIQACENCGGVA